MGRWNAAVSVTPARPDEGAILPLVAVSLLVLFVFAAFVFDLGHMYNARRQAQSAADSSALAATWEITAGETQLRDTAMDYARRNLDKKYTNLEWAELWATCADAGRPAGFASVPGTDCVSIDYELGLVRVRIPEQVYSTFFASVIGIDTLATRADATVGFRTISPRPFAVPSGAPGGTYCLQNPPGGHALAPCSGPNSGNFGSLRLNRYSEACPANNSYLIVRNTALGIDHGLGTYSLGDPIVADGCYNTNPNQTATDTGNFPKPITDGFLTGGADLGPGDIPMLRQGLNSKVDIVLGGSTYPADNRPLWRYIIPNSIPGCDPGGFVGLNPQQASERTHSCLSNWTGGELFSTNLFRSPRFMIIPELSPDSDINGSSDVRFARFRAVYLDLLVFGGSDLYYPGATGPVVVGGNIEQSTSFLLPTTPLLSTVVNPNGGVLPPAIVELVG